MQKPCLYCQRPLGFEKSVQGQLFCSPDHRESYLLKQTPLNSVQSYVEPRQLLGSQVPNRVVDRLGSRPMPVTPEIKVLATLRPAQLDPIVRFAARVGGFGPFKPERSLRPWAFSAMAAGVTLLALLSVPYWTGERSLVTRVSAASPLHAAPISPGFCLTGKTRRIMIDGQPVGPVGAFEFPRVAAGRIADRCADRQIVFPPPRVF